MISPILSYLSTKEENKVADAKKNWILNDLWLWSCFLIGHTVTYLWCIREHGLTDKNNMHCLNKSEVVLDDEHWICWVPHMHHWFLQKTSFEIFALLLPLSLNWHVGDFKRYVVCSHSRLVKYLKGFEFANAVFSFLSFLDEIFYLTV